MRKALKDVGLSCQYGVFFSILLYAFILALVLPGFSAASSMPGIKAAPINFIFLKIAGYFILNGVVFGIFSAAWWLFITGGSILEKNLPLRKILYSLTVFIFWLFFVTREMIFKPTFFNRFARARFPFLENLQYWFTDNIPLKLLDAGYYVFLSVFLLSAVVFFFKRFRYKAAGCFIIFLLVWLFFSVSGKFPARGKNTGPNVLLICVDTLRPDHLSYNGYFRPTTLNMDRLAAKGASFSNVFVSIARTASSVASLLTGCFPLKHGIRDMFPDAFESRLQGINTLPRILKARGYVSEVVGDYSAEMFNNIDFGFQKVLCPRALSLDNIVEREILLEFIAFMPNVNNAFGRWWFPVLRLLEANDDPALLCSWAEKRIKYLASSSDKFFLTVFFSAPHIPFNPVYPYYKTYSSNNYRGKNKYSCGFDSISRMGEYSESTAVPEEEKAQIIALYDGAVKSVDEQVGILTEFLKKTGLYDNTVLIITGDHGEDFYEDGPLLGHGFWFKGEDKANRVPLIICYPGLKRQGIRNGSLVRNTDVMPTVMEILGIEAPAGSDGVSLMPIIKGLKDNLDLRVFCETGIWFDSESTFKGQPGSITYPPVTELLTYDPRRGNILVLKRFYKDVVNRAKHLMLRENGWKFVYTPRDRGCRVSLFDTSADPLCLNDLSGDTRYSSQEQSMLGSLRKYYNLGDLPVQRVSD